MNTNINLDEPTKIKKYGRNYLHSSKMPKWITIVGNVFFFFITALSLATAILACIFVRTPVVGPSMQPTINSAWTDQNNLSDMVMVNRLQKGERGDVIVINHSTEEESHYLIKRLIATGGDYITIAPIVDEFNLPTGYYQILVIKKGETTPTVFDDGRTNMQETYTKFNRLKSTGSFVFKTIGSYEYLHINDNEIFYLGDNRNLSQDCSLYGPISAEKVIGKVVLVIPHDQSVFKNCFKYFVNKIF